MRGFKDWHKSKGVVAGVVAVLLYGLSLLGFDLDEGTATEVVVGIGIIASMLIAIYGRIVANVKIR